MAGPFLQGMQFGFDASLRMQQLRSEQAARRVREENAAKLLSMKIQENDLAIQERADMAKAITAAQDAMSPEIMVPMPDQEGLGDMAPPVMPVPNPNPMTREQAAMRFVLPVVSKYRPDQVPNFLEGVALAEARQRAGETFTPTGGEVALPGGQKVPFIKTSPRSAQVIDNQGTAFAPSPWERMVGDYEKRTGKKLSDTELKKSFDVAVGLEPRAAVVQPSISRADYIARNLQSAKRADRAGLVAPSQYKTDQQLISELGAQWEDLYGSQGEAAGGDDPEELIWVVDPSGKRGRLPRRNLERALKQGYTLFEG